MHRRSALAVRSAPVALLVAAVLLVTACSAAPPDEVSSGARATDAPRGSAPAPTVASPAGSGTSTTVVIATAGTATTGPTTSTAPPAAPSSAVATTVPAPTTAPRAAGVPANHPVAKTSLPLVDASRPTVSRGTRISGSRALPTTVYAPSDGGGPYPLVVFAHGFQIGPAPYEAFCRKLAAAGYVVAAPSFPLTDGTAAGANLDRGDLPNQAADVSFVISGVTAANAGGPLAGVVDGGRVGIVGHSDGADTALDTGYYPGRTDPRIKAVAALSPDAMTGPGGTTGGATPLLLQHGDRDTIVPYANSQTVWTQVRARRYFLTLTGADHLPPIQGAAPWAPVLEGVTIDFLDRFVAGRTTDDSKILTDGTRTGAATIVAAG